MDLKLQYKDMLDKLKFNNFITDEGRFNPNSKKMFKNNTILLNEIIKITSFLPIDTDIKERFYCISNEIYSVPECVECQTAVKYNVDKKRYNEFCTIECAINSKERLNRIQKTNLEKYGYPCSLQNNSIYKKARKTMIKKYGHEFSVHSKEIEGKRKKTCFEKYGNENPSKNKEVIKKIKTTTKTKYGVENYAQINIPPDVLDKLNDKSWLEFQHITRKLSQKDISQELGVTQAAICLYFKKHNITTKQFKESSGQREVKKYLESIYDETILSNKKNIIPRTEIDIFLPNNNLAIEYNGIYWHSEKNGKDKNYHVTKLRECEKNNIRLITILDIEWLYKKEIVKSIISGVLNNSTKIMASMCRVKHIERAEADLFLEQNHIKGASNSVINIGLIFNNDIVCLMYLNKTNIGFNLLGYSSRIFTDVVGGCELLFSFFVDEYKPSIIYSLSDNRWIDDIFLNILEFKLVKNEDPKCMYFRCNNVNELLSEDLFQTQNLENILNIYNPNLSEWQNIKNNNYNRIYDCGWKKWEWIK